MADDSNHSSSAADGGSTLPISLSTADDSNNNHNSSSSSSAAVLFKNRSWSPAAIHRDVEWEMLRINHRRRLRRTKSFGAASDPDVTDDDIKELRACFELGFGFDPDNDLDPKLASAFPALQMYTDVNRQFNNHHNNNLSRSSSMDSDSSSNSDNSSSNLIIDPNDDPEKVKMRLKLWALVVASSVREGSGRELVSA